MTPPLVVQLCAARIFHIHISHYERDETVAAVVKPFVFSQSHTALTSRWRVPPSAAPSTQLYISPVWRLLRHLPGQLGENMPRSSVGWCWAARQLIFRHDLIVKRNYRKTKKRVNKLILTVKCM